MAQEVEDWSVVVSESVQKLNGRLKSTVEGMAIPEEVWDQQTYPNEPEYLESFTTGLADGVFEEITNIPLLLSLVADYTTNASARDSINTAIANIDVDEIIENFIQGREELYTGGNPYRIKHQTGKDMVAAGTLLGTGGAATLGRLKKGVEFIEELSIKIRSNFIGRGRFFRNIEDFKEAVLRGENVFYVGKHNDITPRPVGVQSHHGVNTVWMKAKYSNYSANKAPSIYMLNNPNHNATRGVFNTWRSEISKVQGVKITQIDYSKITKDDILRLAERQFDAADVPKTVRDEYYRLWDEYLTTLIAK